MLDILRQLFKLNNRNAEGRRGWQRSFLRNECFRVVEFYFVCAPLLGITLHVERHGYDTGAPRRPAQDQEINRIFERQRDTISLVESERLQVERCCCQSRWQFAVADFRDRFTVFIAADKCEMLGLALRKLFDMFAQAYYIPIFSHVGSIGVNAQKY